MDNQSIDQGKFLHAPTQTPNEISSHSVRDKQAYSHLSQWLFKRRIPQES